LATLKPGVGKHCEVSQKIVSATACRYLIFWMHALLQHCNTNDRPGMLFGNDWSQVLFLMCPPLLKLKDQTTDIPPQEKTSTNILNGFGVN